MDSKFDSYTTFIARAEIGIQGLQRTHRMLSDQITTCNREILLAQVAKDKGQLERLAERLEQLRVEQTAIDETIVEQTEFIKEIHIKLGMAQPEKEADHTERGLVKDRHPNRDFFVADLFDYALKDDGASMEAPIFTLSTKPDTSVWEWRSKDGNKQVKVVPSVLGRATQHDKDILIYVVSQLTEALNRGREDAQNRTVRFTVYDFLVTTNRQISGEGYRLLHEAFERLRGTSITTDIKTGGTRVREGFGVIDKWKIIEKSATDQRMIAVEVTLSEWLYNAVQAFEVLTIHPDYFRLRKPLARRLYEIARKHCGHQTQWVISLDLLREKSGSKSPIKEFRRMIRAIEADKSLPEYKISLGADDKVTFYAADGQRLVRGLAARLPAAKSSWERK